MAGRFALDSSGQTYEKLEPLGRRELEPLPDLVSSMTPLPGGRLLLGSARGVSVICEWSE